jgi:hypothetical protein
MSNLINQLASINIQQNLPAAIDVDNIARTFAENFKKLALGEIEWVARS